jgi:hypothetical protein
MKVISEAARRVVDRHQHGASRRHAVVRLEQRRDVGCEERDPVAWLDSGPGERRREAIDAFIEFAVGVAPLLVDHRDLLRVDVGAAPEKAHG